MADIRYGFVDDGNQTLTPNTNNSNNNCSGNAALSKVEALTNGAPIELDTFKEVADKINAIVDKVNELEKKEGVDLSDYATKEDLCMYITREEAASHITAAELDVELVRFKTELNDSFVKVSDFDEKVNEVLDNEFIKRTEVPNLSDENKIATEQYVDDKVDEIEIYESISGSDIDQIFLNKKN